MFIALFLLWLVFNGRITVEIVLLGLVIAAALTLFWHKVFHTSRNLVLPSGRMLLGGIAYALALVREMVACNLHVMKLILHPSYEVKPQLIHFRTGVKSDLGRTILSNSITLTPGTITVGLEGDHLCVHALDVSLTEGLEEGKLARRLEKMEAEE